MKHNSAARHEIQEKVLFEGPLNMQSMEHIFKNHQSQLTVECILKTVTI